MNVQQAARVLVNHTLATATDQLIDLVHDQFLKEHDVPISEADTNAITYSTRNVQAGLTHRYTDADARAATRTLTERAWAEQAGDAA